MDRERSSKKTPDLKFRGSYSTNPIDHFPSLTIDSGSTLQPPPPPPTIQVCSDDISTGFLELPSRNPRRLRSPSVSDLPRPRGSSISEEAISHRHQERRLSYQLQTSGAFEDDPEWEGGGGGRPAQSHRGPQQLSPGLFGPTRSRAEEPYVFSMSQTSSAGRMSWDRRGSAPQVSEPTESPVSKFQRSPEKFPLPVVRANVPTVKEATQRTPSPIGKHLQGTIKATSSVDRWTQQQAGSHSRWATRALSLPVSESLIASGGEPEASGYAGQFAAASSEGAAAAGSRFISEQTRSLLLCPPELPGRRRSVSTEWCAHLESIAEESAALQKSNRRYSIPSLPATEM